MPPSPTHILIAANPKSGASSRVTLVGELGERLQAKGFEVAVCHSLEEIAQRTAKLFAVGKLHAVVAAGGDGTAAAVVNLIPETAPMAILPLGTENLLAKHLGLSCDVESAANSIAARNLIQLDAGRAGGRLFLVMLGCGFDAEVVTQLHQVRRGHINRWSYAKPIWRAVRNYRYPAIDIECLDGAQQSTQQGADAPSRFSTAWLFAFNLPRYAANLRFCPQAHGNDGLLDLCMFKRGGLAVGLGYLIQLWMGRHQQLRDFQHFTSKRFRLTSAGRVPYQVDGDPGGYLPLDVEVLPNRLTLIVPAT